VGSSATLITNPLPEQAHHYFFTYLHR